MKCDEHCVDDTMRLNDGETDFEGRLEICRGNVWIIACPNSWNEDNARVVCQQLGFSPVEGRGTRE